MINNRQQGRRRGRGNGPQRPGGGGQGQRDSGNRIDSRARGNAAQLLEKYKNMARDAQMSGDRVNTEYYLQFADHYFRVLADQRGRSEEQGQQRRQPRDDFDQFDPFDDFGDEGDPVRADEMQRAQEGERLQGERQQGERQQGDRAQNDRSRGERDRQRDDRSRDDRQVEGRQAEPRQERPRFDRDDRQRQPREERPRFDRVERRPVETTGDAREEDRRPARARQPAIANDLNETLPASADPAPAPGASTPDLGADEAPRRRTRTRKVRDDATETAPPTEALDADRLPPSLGVVRPSEPDEAAPSDAAETPKPRRRRLVRTASGEATPAE